MLLKYFYDPALAQASYMLACQSCGEAIVIDPARDITPYLDAAARENVQIAHVAETHIHADFVSGSRELAAATGAHLYLSGMGGSDWQYGYDTANTHLLQDQDIIMVGRIQVGALHTPGHTPEHLCFFWMDTAAANKLGKAPAPMGIISGDCLFVGDVGRPDLLETAVGMIGTKEAGALDQFRNVQRFKTMPDYLQILPGHGAGSACGKSLGAVPSTTLGYEKLFNPAFQYESEDLFVAWLLEGQPEVPRYFARMKQVNRAGAPLLASLPPIERVERFILDEALRNGAFVIDARPADEFAAAHVPGAVHIPPAVNFPAHAGWLIPDDQPVYLIANPEDYDRLVKGLRAIGVDVIAGYADPNYLRGDMIPVNTITPEAAAGRLSAGDAVLLDVRAASERAEAHIPDSIHIHYGQLPDRFSELPLDKPIIIHCTSGTRSLIAASVLQKAGARHVMNMSGGIQAWDSAGLEVFRGL